jgi:hypothetical protein
MRIEMVREFGRAQDTERDRRIEKLTTDLLGLPEAERAEVIGVGLLVPQICEEDLQEEGAPDQCALAETIMGVLETQLRSKHGGRPERPPQPERDRRVYRVVRELMELPEAERAEVIGTVLWIQDFEAFSGQQHSEVSIGHTAVPEPERRQHSPQLRLIGGGTEPRGGAQHRPLAATPVGGRRFQGQPPQKPQTEGLAYAADMTQTARTAERPREPHASRPPETECPCD